MRKRQVSQWWRIFFSPSQGRAWTRFAWYVTLRTLFWTQDFAAVEAEKDISKLMKVIQSRLMNATAPCPLLFAHFQIPCVYVGRRKFHVEHRWHGQLAGRFNFSLCTTYLVQQNNTCMQVEDVMTPQMFAQLEDQMVLLRLFRVIFEQTLIWYRIVKHTQLWVCCCTAARHGVDWDPSHAAYVWIRWVVWLKEFL